MKPTVYIETTIPGYLTAWPRKDVILAAHQQLTRDWWAQRDAFELFTSDVVWRECQAGDPQAAADRLAALTGITLLEQNGEIEKLAEALIGGLPLPPKAGADAFHIATAAAHGMQY